MAEPRVILVTGARKGIGRALAEHYLDRGDTVVGLSREPSDFVAPAYRHLRADAWVKVGGEGSETRIVDGILQIKARSAMLVYLNAPSPFTEDGWFNTSDAVSMDGHRRDVVQHLDHALEDPRALTARVKEACRERLQPFKVPVKVKLVEDRQYSDRFKKTRVPDA